MISSFLMVISIISHDNPHFPRGPSSHCAKNTSSPAPVDGGVPHAAMGATATWDIILQGVDQWKMSPLVI